MFDKIFHKATISRENNAALYQEMLRLEKERKAKEESENSLKNTVRYMNVDYRSDNCSDELLELIDQYEFEILSYEKNLNDELDSDTWLEIYRCRKNNWTFEIKNYPDYDIEEGIYSIGNLKNILIGRDVNFYCDLGCRNTCQSELDAFIRLLDCNSEKQYVEETYKEFYDIPLLLVRNGMDCTVIEEDFTIGKGGFTCKIDFSSSPLKKEKDKVTVLYLKFRHYIDKDSQLFVCREDERKFVSFHRYSDDDSDLKYYFNYTDRNDIDELVKCINCFYEHSNRRVGYLEEGKYYSNHDVIKYFKSVMDNNEIFEKRNHHLIRMEDIYGSSNCCVNKYKGVEIYVGKNLIINDAGGWAEGDEINSSHITVEYNTNKDNKSCVLSIKNYIYKNTDSIYDTIFEDHIYDIRLNPTFMVDELEIKGSFSYIMKCLDEYVTNMMKIYEILK